MNPNPNSPTGYFAQIKDLPAVSGATRSMSRYAWSGTAGRANIPQSTCELVKNEYRCESRGKIAAKHKGGVEMYFAGAKRSASAQ